MEPGQVARLSYITDVQPGVQTGWRPPKGYVYVVVVLGFEPKDGSDPLDEMAAMQAMGWQQIPEPAAPAERGQ